MDKRSIRSKIKDSERFPEMEPVNPSEQLLSAVPIDTDAYRVPNHIQLEAAKMLNDGRQLHEVATKLNLPFEVVEARHGAWLTLLQDTRFKATASSALTPSQKLNEVMPLAVQQLEERNIDGFFATVAPIVAIQLVRDSILATDERIRHSAQKDILDRAGYKPKTQVEVYTKYDRMQRDEIIASLRGAMMKNPNFAEKVLQIQASMEDPLPDEPVTNETILSAMDEFEREQEKVSDISDDWEVV